MANRDSRLQRWRTQAQALLNEGVSRPGGPVRRWQKFVHFWVLVARSFNRNRCPIRASALAYTTLLALIPMLAVAISVTSSILKKQGEERIYDFIGTVVASLTPPASLSTNYLAGSQQGIHRRHRAAPPGTGEQTNVAPDRPAGVSAAEAATIASGEVAGTNAPSTSSPTNAVAVLGNETNVPAAGNETNAPSVIGSNPSTNQLDKALLEDQNVIKARKAIARQIHDFIQNTRSGTLGVTGSVLLIFVGISMLSRIEATFNDIWGVQRGRSWFMRVVLYWGVLTLVPVLLVVAVGLATGPHLEATKKMVATLPLVGNFLFNFGIQLLPVVVLCLTFAVFYMLMPNTRVHWKAALVGGLIAGLLFHLNSMVSVLYVSRVVANSKIYGSLGLVPVFMIGLYFCWLILLFGAQVAYAYQNRTAYFEERQIEQINQRGREFIALRLMTLVGARYLRGEPPPSVPEMAEQLCVPSRLLQQILQTLGLARLVAETAGGDCGYLPARPLEHITCHDVLLAMRASQGQELATRDEPTRSEVYGEFQRIQEAERQAASSITLRALVNRAQQPLPA